MNFLQDTVFTLTVTSLKVQTPIKRPGDGGHPSLTAAGHRSLQSSHPHSNQVQTLAPVLFEE